jgi:hypothetical protein
MHAHPQDTQYSISSSYLPHIRQKASGGVSLALVSPRPCSAKAHAVTGVDPRISLNLL